MDLGEIEKQICQHLGTSRAPVAVTFCASPPAGVRRFLGQVPSGCSFWSIAASAPAGRSAFYTLPADHYNCPIGSYTHRVDLPPERGQELEEMLGLMVKMGYVKSSEVPEIPRWPETPGAVVYARLAEAPLPPDVVLLALPPRAAMLLVEASRAAGKGSGLEPLPRPTCMAIPAAAGHGTTLSLACIGNRVYTDVPDSDVYVMLRGADLEAIVAALPTIARANAELASFHRQRRQTLSRPESP